MGELKGWIIPALFQENNGLSTNIHTLGKVFLRQRGGFP